MSAPNTLKHPSDLGVDDWFLFTCSMDCTDAAAALKAALIQGLAGRSRKAAKAVIDSVRAEWWQFGAQDTEPREFVNQYLEAKFPLYSGADYVIGAPKH